MTFVSATSQTSRTHILEQRVVEVPMFERYQQLKDTGTLPVCMFATRKACAEFNDMALDSLATEKHELLCVLTTLMKALAKESGLVRLHKAARED